MRLFIAAELPQHMREALAETSASLRGCVSGRYVGSDLFHVTLAFLGSVEGARVPRCIDALERGCAGHAPFGAALGELGSFGRRSKATLWQGFEDAGGFAELATDIRASLEREGFEFDAKKFLPHVTLMRAVDLTAGSLPMPHLACGRIDAVTLFSSDLSGASPVYEPLHSVVLG